ncbi:MAG: DUF488 domain-containing protein, partial [Actinomycetota bacterium]|nr:DUF488 domain-containing protein [Actinomycetota bacterium]
LQDLLARAQIAYRHELALAPTRELMALQAAADARSGTARRLRTELSPEFIAGWERHRLDPAVLEALADDARARTIALFCVEAEPTACHRSLIAARLSRELGLQIEHLRP